MGEVEDRFEYQRDRGMGVTVYFETRKGAASTADLTEDALRETVAKACSIARLHRRGFMRGTRRSRHARDRHPRSRPVASLGGRCRDGQSRLARALRIGRDGRRQTHTSSDGAGVSSHAGVRAYGNSHGFMAAYPGSLHGISCAVIGVDGDEMQRDYWYTQHARLARPRGLSRPSDAAAAGLRGRAARGAQGRHHPRTGPLFAGRRSRIDRALHIGAVRGGSQYRRASFLLDAAGRQVFPDWFELQERPHLPKALGSAPFDNEGVATRDRNLVTNGVLEDAC